MHHRRPDQLARRRPQYRFFRLGSLFFIAAAAAGLALTVYGGTEFIDQVTAAQDTRSSLISTVMNFGWALLGPVLLYALGILAPRHWVPPVFERVGEHLGAVPRKKPQEQTSSR